MMALTLKNINVTEVIRSADIYYPKKQSYEDQFDLMKRQY